jgi:hypothetical protein
MNLRAALLPSGEQKFKLVVNDGGLKNVFTFTITLP